MQKTRDRNAVLLYFAPRTRIFAIIGDTGVHAKCGAEFWEKVAAQITLDIHQGTITEAIVHAVHTVGELLAAHFPYESGDKNELSDAVGHD
ncbi:MAG: hypothetical protein QOD99_1654 [Chthoniobacter sp.]|nr:hypothetical protein [Chthoniobacter sp.]